MYFLSNLSHCVKSYEHFCQILAFFYDARSPNIWSCHMIQDANFENLLFCLNFTFNIRKTHKFLVEKLSTSEVISQKTSPGWKTSPLPVSLGLSFQNFLLFCVKIKKKKLIQMFS